ncbi:dehydration-responsive element-binding protein 1b [Fagus crenata]
MAARAYDVAALALRGTVAELNFPDSAWLVPRANSSSARDIQLAAQQAAEAFRPSTITSTTPSSPSSSSNIILSDNKSQEKVLEPCLVDMQSVESKNNVLEHDFSSGILCANNSEVVQEEPSRTFFWDEEALFNMPALLDSMAEGLILTPPARQRGFDWDDLDSHFDLTLWTD